MPFAAENLFNFFFLLNTAGSELVSIKHKHKGGLFVSVFTVCSNEGCNELKLPQKTTTTMGFSFLLTCTEAVITLCLSILF